MSTEYCKKHEEIGNSSAKWGPGDPAKEIERLNRLRREIKCPVCFSEAFCDPSVK